MKHATKKLLSLLLVAMVLIGVFAVTTHADEYPTITPENDPLIYTLNQKYDGTAHPVDIFINSRCVCNY